MVVDENVRLYVCADCGDLCVSGGRFVLWVYFCVSFVMRFCVN